MTRTARITSTALRRVGRCTWALPTPTINRVVAEQMERYSHIHQGFDTPARFYLARRLAQIAPGDLNRVSFTVGGGVAMEAAMKIAYKNTQPSRDFICLYDSYHGTTLGTMGASWISTRSAGKLMGGSRFLGSDAAVHPRSQPVLLPLSAGAEKGELRIGLCPTAAADAGTRNRRQRRGRDSGADSGQRRPDRSARRSICKRCGRSATSSRCR